MRAASRVSPLLGSPCVGGGGSPSRVARRQAPVVTISELSAVSREQETCSLSGEDKSLGASYRRTELELS